MPSLAISRARPRAAQTADSTQRLYRRASLAIAGAATAIYGVFIARSAFSVGGRTYFSLFDDGMISMRYARNLAHGAGLAWNAGQPPVEGYTNFLWTLWMAALHLTGVSDASASLLVMVSGVAILVGNLFVVRAIVETLAPGRRGVALVAMAATAAYYPLVFWTLRGMEVGLITLLTSAMVLYALRLERAYDARTLAKLAAVLAAAVLARDDGAVPCIVVLVFVVLRCTEHRRLCGAVLGGALATAIGGHEAFRLAYYGNALPNTYYLKLGGVPLGARLSHGSDVFASIAVHSLLGPVALAVAGLTGRARRASTGLWLLAAIVAADAGYSIYVGGDAWEAFGFTNRFITPAVPLLLVLAALGFGRLRDRATKRHVRFLAVALAGLGLLHLALTIGAGTLPHLPFMPYGGRISEPDVIQAIGLLLVGGTVSVSLARGRDARLIWPMLAIALVIATAGDQGGGWRSSGHSEVDAPAARLGVKLRHATQPGTTVAVVWAGAIAYFDHRPSIDLLGKSDTFVAHEPPHPIGLYPGHMKWDYAYSVAALRPDVITQLWRPTAGDLDLLHELGYVSLSGNPSGMYVRRDAHGVDRARLMHPSS